MAGSYNHVVTDSGNLGDSDQVNDMLENGGDVFEAVEEMYGMIWYLAAAAFAPETSAAARVEEARQNYQVGLRVSEDLAEPKR